MVPEYLDENFREWVQTASVAALAVIAQGLARELEARCGGLRSSIYHEAEGHALALTRALRELAK